MKRAGLWAAGKRGPWIVPFLFLFLVWSMVLSQELEDWASSPEAYFLTQEERAEWKSLDSGAARDRFKERYWLKRDPTPDTEKNEFRDTVLARIKTADARFPIAKTSGSRTKRGMVFILFGTPARVQDSPPRAPEPPRAPQAGVIGSPPGASEAPESTSAWLYDRERTPRLLEALGNRPSLEITFVIDPNRRRDDIQNPGLVAEYREVLARKSIVNPDLVPASSATEGFPAAAPALPRAALSAGVRSALENARAVPRGPDGSVFGSAVLWRTTEPQSFVWFFLPEPEEGLTLHGRIRSETGAEVATISERAASSSSFSTSAPKGQVIVRRLKLPPGSYSAAFAVQGKRTRTAASTTLQVPSFSSGFAVSSLVLSAGAGKAKPGASDGFLFGQALVPPRADSVFLRSESLWYFLEVAGPSDPGAVTLETRLRRGSERVGAAGPFPAGLVEIAPGRYVCGFELPLATLAPGEYVLYVTVREKPEEGGRSVLRRGDFQLRDSSAPPAHGYETRGCAPRRVLVFGGSSWGVAWSG